MAKVIITAAITGSIHTPSMSPYLPVTPEQIADEAIKVHEAGGAVAHIHVRDPQTGYPTADQDAYREIAVRIKKKCDIVLCFTTGGRLAEPVEKRVKVVSSLKPEMASLNAGSLNFGLFHVVSKIKKWKYQWEKEYLEGTEDVIFPNTFKTMREYLAVIYGNKAKPELEIYDAGMINNVAFLIKAGYVRKPVYLQFVMGILGGIPATPQNLIFLVESAKSAIGEFEFSVCAAGKMQFPLCTQSLILGGHARVGLEDNLYLNKGVIAKSNAEQVSKVIRIAKELGLEPATPNEARKILNLKGLGRVNF
jgi:uncharacterized protein (DUF849 family)